MFYFIVHLSNHGNHIQFLILDQFCGTKELHFLFSKKKNKELHFLVFESCDILVREIYTTSELRPDLSINIIPINSSHTSALHYMSCVLGCSCIKLDRTDSFFYLSFTYLWQKCFFFFLVNGKNVSYFVRHDII